MDVTLDVPVGELVLSQIDNAAAYGQAPSTVLARGPEWSAAQLVALLSAELLAAQAGVVPFVDTPYGPGVLELGAARSVIERPERWQQTGRSDLPGAAGFRGVEAFAQEAIINSYLGTYAQARRTHALTHPFKGTPPALPKGGVQVGQVGPVGLLALTAVGIAGVIAAAWYAVAVTEKWITVRADEAVDLAKVRAVADAGRAQIASGQDPTALDRLATVRGERGGSSWGWYAAAGGVVLAVGVGIGVAAHSEIKRRREAGA